MQKIYILSSFLIIGCLIAASGGQAQAATSTRTPTPTRTGQPTITPGSISLLQTLLYKLKGPTSWVGSLAFSPDGKWFATAGKDGSVGIWDACSPRLVTTLLGHTGPVQGVAFSPDSLNLASVGQDGYLRQWELKTEKMLYASASVGGKIWGVAFSRDGKLLATCDEDGAVRLWKPKTGKVQDTFKSPGGKIWNAVFNKDGSRLLVAGDKVYLWDVKAKKLVLTVDTKASSADFSPDGLIIATAGKDVQLWNAATGKLINTLTGHTGWVWWVSFNPAGGTLLATASKDKTVRLWDSVTGKALTTLAGHTDEVNGLAFGAGGNLLASASTDATIQLWWLGQGAAPTLMPTPRPKPTHTPTPAPTATPMAPPEFWNHLKVDPARWYAEISYSFTTLVNRKNPKCRVDADRGIGFEQPNVSTKDLTVKIKTRVWQVRQWLTGGAVFYATYILTFVHGPATTYGVSYPSLCQNDLNNLLDTHP